MKQLQDPLNEVIKMKKYEEFSKFDPQQQKQLHSYHNNKSVFCFFTPFSFSWMLVYCNRTTDHMTSSIIKYVYKYNIKYVANLLNHRKNTVNTDVNFYFLATITSNSTDSD